MRRGLPAPATRCPLTVVGGFLGAGKTTLLNRLLAGSQGRYAVLVNDFGAINVDAGLIRDHDGQTLRLTNGCVCCSLADGFLDTLMRVLAEPEPFDHIVIEASGVGDVSDVSAAPGFLTEDAVIERYARGSDRDLSGFGFYLGLAAFKLAAILEGIHYRHLHGQTVGAGFEGIGEAIHPLLDAGLAALDPTH